MKIANFDDQTIEITAVYFRGQKGSERLESYPRRMVMDGQEYTFLESGMRYLVQKGQQLIRLFDVTDGQNQYRLRVDHENHWTLVGMKAAA